MQDRRAEKRAYRNREHTCAEYLAQVPGIWLPAEVARELSLARTKPLRVRKANGPGDAPWDYVIMIGKRRSQILSEVYDLSPVILTDAAMIAGSSIVFKLEEF